MTDGADFHPRHDELVDHLLGESSPGDIDRDCRRDPLLGAERAELRQLFRDLREIETRPTDRVGLSLRYQVMRRQSLRGSAVPGRGPWQMLRLGAQVAAVAMLSFAGFQLVDWWSRQEGAQQDAGSRIGLVEYDGQPVMLQDLPRGQLSKQEPRLREVGVARQPDRGTSAESDRPLARLAFVDPLRNPILHSKFEHILAGRELGGADAMALAHFEWANLRLEFRNRFNPQVRSRAMRYAGVGNKLEARVQALADAVALRLRRSLAAPQVDSGAVSLALRALVASGSSRRLGLHREEVQLASQFLLRRLPRMAAAEKASALAGLMDLAVIGSRQVGTVVGRELAALTAAISEGQGEDGAHRPRILSWQSTVTQLADAGQVLRVAAAFGVDPREARRARALALAHLEERLASSSKERPDLLAAQLYGFGDLVDRERSERRMLLWPARDLAEESWVAVLHVCWSRFSSPRGFAQFQRELRRVASLPTPESTEDAAAMLMSLAMNYAAPGSAGIHEIVMR